MAKTRRAYEGAAVPTTISGSLSNVATSITIAGYTNWPYGANPFYIVVSPGTASEEKMLVTRTGNTDLTLNVVSGGRGVDGTSAVSHVDGAETYPVFTATDADEANEMASTLTTKGDLLSHGASTFERVGVGSDGQALLADSSTASGLAWGSVVTQSLVDAKGDLLAGTADNTVGRLAVGADGQFLVADSGETAGLKWANPGTESSSVLAFGSFA